MQTPGQWVLEHTSDDIAVQPEELERLSRPPDPGVYHTMEKGVRRIVIHHSATETGSAAAFRALHRAVFGWDDIGYHFVIGNGSLSGDGELEEGRPVWAVGAHSRENNQDSLGICLVGNFDDAKPTVAQIRSLSRLLEDLMSRFGLTESDIYLHRDLPPCVTRCPGANLSIPLIREFLRAGY